MSECYPYNKRIELVDVTSESGIPDEPVTIDEFKNYARLEGFEAAGSGTAMEFTSDDEFITDLITGAREMLELWTGRSLVAHTWKLRFTNGLGGYTLPFSNGATVTELLDSDNEAIIADDYTVEGLDFKSLASPTYENMTITYTTAGNCPKRLKNAILAEVLYRYENRGDITAEGSISEKARAIAAPFKLVDTWLQ
jgi:hypothetical protein